MVLLKQLLYLDLSSNEKDMTRDLRDDNPFFLKDNRSCWTESCLIVTSKHMYANTYICVQKYTCLHMYVYIHRARSYDILWKRIWKDYTWRNKSIPYMHSYIRNRKMTETLEQINVLIWADNFWELWNSWPNLPQHNYPGCQNIDYLV